MSKLDALQDIDAERALIGACLLSDRAIEDSRLIIEPADFSKQTHRDIYAEILDQYKTGRVDSVTLASKLHDPKIPEYLHELQNATPTISNAKRYAINIVEWRLRRDLIHASDTISRMAFEGHDPDQVVHEARRILDPLEMPAGTGAPDPDVDSFINATPSEYDWLIPGFLERRDRMLVTAGEGSGKSVLIAQIGVMAAAGIHPWTLRPTKPVNVTIIDLENGTKLVARRLAWLKKNAPDLDPQRLRVHVDQRGINLTTRADRRWLMDRCIANATDLLVIGPAYRMTAGVAARGDVGGEDQVREVTKALDDIRNRCDVTLLLETHAPHSRDGMTRDLRPFGSSVWLRWPEFGVGIRKDGPMDEETVEYELAHWRGPRDQRTWPTKLIRGGKTWPWMPAGMPNGTFTR